MKNGRLFLWDRKYPLGAGFLATIIPNARRPLKRHLTHGWTVGAPYRGEKHERTDDGARQATWSYCRKVVLEESGYWFYVGTHNQVLLGQRDNAQRTYVDVG